MDPTVWSGASTISVGVRRIFDYTNREGYQYQLTYNVAAPTATTSLVNAKPGEVDVELNLTGALTIANKSGGRTAPANYLPALYPYWTDPAVCDLDTNNGGAVKVLNEAFSPGTVACTRSNFNNIDVPKPLDPDATEERPIATSDIFTAALGTGARLSLRAWQHRRVTSSWEPPARTQPPRTAKSSSVASSYGRRWRPPDAHLPWSLSMPPAFLSLVLSPRLSRRSWKR
ncbi:hypothetical protein [Cryobacterium sp. N22]|uniref:hypothetical protein n=1 Tax=Cryobacterium sp. N22 TaxID=2048290 RepID=UPI0011B057F3|nr:hypothetical protein [Cryobacterium sp. N22]